MIRFFGLALIILAGSALQGQVLIAKWTFPTGGAGDSLADGGLDVNRTMAIHTEGGTSAIDFSKNGATTKAAQATGWNDGAMLKCWVVRVNTTSHENLKLTSKQQSGGNNPGPRDYSVQYRIGSTGNWTDVPNTTMVTANNWTSAFLDSVALPSECDNKALVYLRWLQLTNIDHTGGTVVATGIDKIDDIYITGKATSTGADETAAQLACTLFPVPSAGPVTITCRSLISTVEVMDMRGRIQYSESGINRSQVVLHVGHLKNGRYLVRIRDEQNRSGIQNMIIAK